MASKKQTAGRWRYWAQTRSQKARVSGFERVTAITTQTDSNPGYGALATREGLNYIDRNRPGPCILETTELRAKAIYEHFGFEVCMLEPHRGARRLV